jgi:hypothetical protein
MTIPSGLNAGMCLTVDTITMHSFLTIILHQGMQQLI